MGDRRTVSDMSRLLAVARGDEPADLVISGASVLCVFTKEWIDGDVAICDGWIAGVGGTYTAHEQIDARGSWLIPGFVDAHVHIESSKLTPGRFAQTVMPHGTTSVIAEPHEIGNVLGVDGVEWFMDACAELDLDVRMMVPSCVPASQFESAGSTISPEGIARLLAHPQAVGIGEMMNFPGVIRGAASELAKLAVRGDYHVDGHAPGVHGQQLDAYVAAGITSDHESTTVDEARAKLRRGMWVLMRDASNARNLLDLVPLIHQYGTDHCAFCTDDREPDLLLRSGHINDMVRTAVRDGEISPEDAIVLATLNAADAHGLHDIGAIAPGRRANLCLLPDLEHFMPDVVMADGRIVARAGRWDGTAHTPAPDHVCDTVSIAPITPVSLSIAAPDGADDSCTVRVIGIRPGQLITDEIRMHVPVIDGQLQPDPSTDVAKIAVVERHHATGQIGTGCVYGFGLLRGAFASTVAHDAHNIVVVGADDRSMHACVERLAEIGGGIVVCDGSNVIAELALPVAGLMSDAPPHDVVADMDAVHHALTNLGVHVEAPFMVLSFLALSVIPTLKITDQGLIDVDQFALVPLVV